MSQVPKSTRPAPQLKVPLLDLKQQYQTLAAEIEPVLKEVCASQQFILGRQVSQFENAAAAYCRTPFAVGVSSGTDALLLALMGLGIGAGDEVITTPYTFFATAGTIARAGARPVFCDIEPDYFNLDPQAVRSFLLKECERRDGVCVNRRTGGHVRAIMPVHLYGQCAEMTPFAKLATEFDLKVIEDAAQAIGADDADGRRAGSIGDIGCLSFFPTKNLGAFGDAGLCTANDAALAEHLRVLRVHGGKPKYYHAFIGGNFRLDEIQAAVLAIKLKYLDQWTARRQANAQTYAAGWKRVGIEQVIGAPGVRPGCRHTWNQYIVRAPRRDQLREFLASRGIGSEIYYPLALHQQQCFAYLQYADGDFPEAERAARESVALPIYPELDTAQLELVVDTVAEFYA